MAACPRTSGCASTRCACAPPSARALAPRARARRRAPAHRPSHPSCISAPRAAQEYGRVNRKALKARATERLQAAGVALLRTSVGSGGTAASPPIVHARGSSTVTCDDGTRLRARLVVDATGFNSKLTRRAGPANPGYQIAYGILAEVDSYPFDEAAMLFMDFRTSYLPDSGTLTTSGQFGRARTLSKAAAEAAPTFLYAMPMGAGADGRRKVFFEETNLVGRPAMELDECKARLEARLAHLGVRVHSVSEEEHCSIAMGTALPSVTNRVLALGGAAGTVHAASGFQLCRGVASSIGVARSVAASLARARADPAAFDADAAAAEAYAALWPRESRLQRDFGLFGGEFLMEQPATSVRGFFGAFFSLPEADWTGFLAGWPGLPNYEAHGAWERRLLFGVRLWLLATPAVKVQLASTAVLRGGLGFFRSVLPIGQETTFDEPGVAQEVPGAGAHAGR